MLKDSYKIITLKGNDNILITGISVTSGVYAICTAVKSNVQLYKCLTDTTFITHYFD